MCKEFFRSTINSKSEYDTDGFKHTLTIPNIQLNKKNIYVYFKTYFPDFDFKYEEVIENMYSISITTEKSIHDLLTFVKMIFYFSSLFGKEEISIDDTSIELYSNVLKKIDAPFYLRYVFKKTMLNGKKFNKYVDIINTENFKFTIGDTATQRRIFIEKELSNHNVIVDLGCGTGALTKTLNRKSDIYIGIDTDKEVRKRFSSKFPTETILDSLKTFYSETTVYDPSLAIVCCEVIEHMPWDESISFMKEIRDNINFETLIITTPNSDFNTMYLIEGFRHHDHHWEESIDKVGNIVKQIFNDYNISYKGVGDWVKDIEHPTQAWIIRR